MRSSSYILRCAIESDEFQSNYHDLNEDVYNHILSYFLPNNYDANLASSCCPYDINALIQECRNMHEAGLTVAQATSVLTYDLDKEYEDAHLIYSHGSTLVSFYNLPDIQQGFEKARFAKGKCDIIGGYTHTFSTINSSYLGLTNLRSKDADKLPIKLLSTPLISIELCSTYSSDLQAALEGRPHKIYIKQELSPNFPPSKVRQLVDQITNKWASLVYIALESGHFQKHTKEIYDPNLEGYIPLYPGSKRLIKQHPYRKEEYDEYGQTGWKLLNFISSSYWQLYNKTSCKSEGKDYQLRNRVHNAINYLVLALKNEDPIAKMAMSVAAVESLLTKKGENLSESISVRLATLFSTQKERRSDLKKTYKSLYNKRSRLIHGETYLPEPSDVIDWFAAACRALRYLLLWVDFTNKAVGPEISTTDRSKLVSHDAFIKEIDECAMNGQYIISINIGD